MLLIVFTNYFVLWEGYLIVGFAHAKCFLYNTSAQWFGPDVTCKRKILLLLLLITIAMITMILFTLMVMVMVTFIVSSNSSSP